MTNLDYLYNPDAAKRFFNFSRFVDKKLGFQVIEHGTILPHKNVNDKGDRGQAGWGGIVDAEGKFIRESHIHTGTGGAYDFPSESLKHSSETVIYLGISFPTWGHAITDNIRRVWFLKSEYMKQFKNCPIVYISYNATLEKVKNFRRLLEILEVDVDNLRKIKQPTQFDKIILPDECFFSKTLAPDDYSFPDNDSLERKFTNEYRQMIDQVRNFAMKNRSPVSDKKIYYFYGMHSLGEERLADYFKSKGYEIISPEKLTLDEQLNLLINAESFASTLGSCSHNSVFLRDNIEAIFIPRRSEYMFHQEALNQVHPINAYYVDSSLSIFYEVIGVHQKMLHCFIVSEQLKRFFGDNWKGYEEADFKIFVDYFKSSVKQCIPLNKEAEKYYGSILPDFIRAVFQRKTCAIDYPDIFPPHWEKFRPLLSYKTHVSREGWNTSWIQENQISNDIEQGLYLQAVKINFSNYKVYYSVYYGKEEGWSEEVCAGEVAGTTGKRKPIYGIKIRLDEKGTKEFNILYRAHNFNEEWTPWAKNNEDLISPRIKINAVQIKPEPKIIDDKEI